MKLTDQSAKKALDRVRICELWEMIDEYPESDVDGRTDWEMIANEAGWLLDSYESDDTCRNEDLTEARCILREAMHGGTFKPYVIQDAKDRVNEYNRLKRFVLKLKGMGLYVPNF